jgi:predicted GIY-YIG superfamily endonuclease
MRKNGTMSLSIRVLYTPMWYSNRIHYVYILECADLTLYTGMTWNVERRIAAHNGILLDPPKEHPADYIPPVRKPRDRLTPPSIPPKTYTSTRRPVKLLQSWEVCCRSCAMSAEKYLKSLHWTAKLELCDNPEQFTPTYCDRRNTLIR